MQAEIIRDDIEINPAATTPEVIGRLAVYRKVRRNQRDVMRPFWKVGAVLDFPDCHYLVRQGCAIPVDDECKERCGMTPEQMALAQKVYEPFSKGIEPDDYELYMGGVITGYDDKGHYILGPNGHLLEEAAAEAAAIDDTPLTATGDSE